MTTPDLESIYREAQSALKAKDYNRASELLRQILVIDENYKDVSRLLAQTVKLKRRRWYNDPRLWGTVGVVAIIAFGVVLAPKVSGLFTRFEPVKPTVIVQPTSTVPPTDILIPTEIVAPAPTSIPLAWKRINIGQDFARDTITAIAIDPKDPDVLYVSMENAGFYQSIDGGISWRPVQKEIPTDIRSKLMKNKNYNDEGEYSIENTASDGKERIYLGGRNWRVSEDGGNTWSEFSLIGQPSSVAITFDATGSVYIYCDSHLCKYSPDGKQRVALGKPDVGAFTIIAISPYDPNTIYVAGEGISLSKDSGLTWTKLNNGLGSQRLDIIAGIGNSSNLYLLTGECINKVNNGAEIIQPLYLSLNGGQTWELSTRIGCYLVKDADNSTVYRTGNIGWFQGDVSRGWFWRSLDGGNSWEKILTPDRVITLTAHLSQSGTLRIYTHYVADDGQEFISEDYGHTWKKQDPLSSQKPCYGSIPRFIDAYRPMAIDRQDGNHVLFIDDRQLQESRDSCGTMHAFATVPNTSMNSIAFDPNNSDTIYAGTDGGAYISFDSGQTWGQVNDGLLGATVVYSIVVDKDSNVYAATPYGIFKLEGK